LAVASSNEIRGAKNTDPAQLIPYSILEKTESFAASGSPKNLLHKSFCSRPDFYYYYYRHSLICLLIRLNDYHKMTFTETGDWLQSKAM
ncbi:MAG: hypothetical protein M3261_02950, partial [Thermoproteota archaeon]|nr:hypothetical protein [Thermoproteota archaeon]